MQTREKRLAKYWSDPEKYRAEARARYAKRPAEIVRAERERERIYKREYRSRATTAVEAYKARDRENARLWNLAHPDRHKAAHIRWAKTHPDRVLEFAREHTNRRRAAKRGNLTAPIDYAAVQYRTCGCCGICGEQVGPQFHYDHIIPIVRGGPHTTENLQLAHPKCNHRKHAKTLPLREAA